MAEVNFQILEGMERGRMFADISDRSLGWDQVDAATQEEIKAAWAVIIRDEVVKAYGQPMVFPPKGA